MREVLLASVLLRPENSVGTALRMKRLECPFASDSVIDLLSQ
jgi:hypothetical protein